MSCRGVSEYEVSAVAYGGVGVHGTWVLFEKLKKGVKKH